MILPRYVPPTQVHDEPKGRCNPSCCKTPYGHSSAAPKTCTCHRKEKSR